MDSVRISALAIFAFLINGCLKSPSLGDECVADEDCSSDRHCMAGVCMQRDDAGADAGVTDMASPDASMPDVGPADAGMDAEPEPDVAPDIPPDLPPCGGACADPRPICDEASDLCVECLTSEHCTDSVCETKGYTCVECVTTNDCATGVCDELVNTCVECLENTDCSAVGASACVNDVCVACATNDDCSHLPNTTLCDAGTCVECTGTDYATCNGPVCETRQRTCSGFPPGMTGLCSECVSDAQCRDGMLCVPMNYPTATDPEVGTFCLWKQSAAGMGAPNGSCSTVAPYSRQVAVRSIDGVMDTVCSLRDTTCAGLRSYLTECPTTMDDECGAPGFDDALCLTDGATYRCTPRCTVSSDCVSATSICDDTVVDRYCTF